MRTERFHIEGMTCPGCAAKVEQSLRKLPGVSACSVDFVTASASITYDPTVLNRDQIETVVRKTGYQIEPAPAAVTKREPRWSQFIPPVGVGALLFGGWLLHATLGEASKIANWISLALILIATALASFPIFRKAVGSLRERRLDADVLVAIAIVAALSIREFIAAGEVAFIMLVGAHLERFTIERARKSLSSLLSLAPQTARVKRGTAETEIPATELRVGDEVIVRPGERIPADGVVTAGVSAVNQAAVTGEAMPVEKSPGDEVFTGTLNTEGALTVRVIRAGEDTTLARISQLVAAAQQRRPPIQRACDRYAAWMIPVMLALAVLVFVFTRDMKRSITVLIVACPCALVLATPTAVVAAISRAAREGILVKDGQHLETAAKLDVIVFDKTGTLTHGELRVEDVRKFCHHSEVEMLALAAVAEKLSEHPVAQAIVRHATRNGKTLGEPAKFTSPQAIVRHATRNGKTLGEPAKFTSHRGLGVTAEHEGRRLLVGQPVLALQQAVAIPEAVASHVNEHREQGHTTVVVAHDGKVCGTICIADGLRHMAEHAISELRRLGIEEIVMLTGDHPKVALEIATRAGISRVQAEVMPEEKVRWIEHFKAHNGRRRLVAMVGDGVNDAPALATADVGIAMGASATDAAHEAADIALMSDDITKIPSLVSLSRRTLRVIKQGLAFALVYNIAMVVTAAEGWLGPAGGAVAHQLSSVAVILNSMRLLWHFPSSDSQPGSLTHSQRS